LHLSIHGREGQVDDVTDIQFGSERFGKGNPKGNGLICEV
jgi:hypothetical protein